MIPRSWLFIPGDSDRKLEKADASGADALILDLEDSVAPQAKAEARQKIRRFLDGRPRGSRTAELWVRINPLDDVAMADLAAIVGGAPDGIMVPKVDGPDDALRLSHALDALEARDDVAPGSIRILPVATETAAAPLSLGAYAKVSVPRVMGLTWGAEDLSAALSASTNLDASGEWAFTYRMVRSMTLLAAKSIGGQAIETLYVDFRDEAGLLASSINAAREGFTGRIAIHPAQVAVINQAFSPSEADIAFAERVVGAFAEQGDAGTIGLDGKMLDIPHLRQARAVLARAGIVREATA